MTCYTRHLQQAMEMAGLAFDAQDKKEADRRLRQVFSLQDAHCPVVWQQVKPLLKDPQVLADRMRSLA